MKCVRERPQPVEPHDLHFRIRLGQPLANTGIVDGAVGPGLIHDQLQLRLESTMTCGGRRPPLEAQRGHRHFPPVVDSAYDVVFRTTGIGEPRLVELGGAVGLHDRTNLHPGLLDGDEEIADTGMLGRRRIGTGEQEYVVRMLGAGGPHLLAIDDPLIAVEHRRGLQRRQIRP